MKVQRILEAANPHLAPSLQRRNAVFFSGALRLVDIMEVSLLPLSHADRAAAASASRVRGTAAAAGDSLLLRTDPPE